MPITSIASYDPTTEAFLINWNQANSELGAAPLTLAGDYSIADFTADRTSMIQSMNQVTLDASTSRDRAADRDVGKFNLLQRHKQFRGVVLGKITAPDYLKVLPASPRPGGDKSKFIDPLRAAANLWTRINTNATALGLSAPLTLAGGYTLAQFQTDITALSDAYEASMQADESTGFARSTRDTNLAAIYERMKQYRAIVPGLLPKTSPARQNLPRLSPLAGTKPQAVAVSGSWDNVLNQARLQWSASGAANLLKLQVRGCTGSTYRPSEESVVADLPIDATQFETNWGLTAPGSKATFKVYVMNTTGNENGGKAVKIVRPFT